MRQLQRLRQYLGGINVRRSLLVVAICGVLAADVLTGGGLRRRAYVLKRYAQVAAIGVVGIGLLLLVNRPGSDHMDMVHTATSVVSAMPSSATTKFMRGGLGYLGGSAVQEGGGGMGGAGGGGVGAGGGGVGAGAGAGGGGVGAGAGGGGAGAGGGVTRRSVSETRKKAVAAGQGWQCAHCGDALEATYEVDHVVELQDGGTNDVGNLAALCRNCHGRKTLNRRLERQ